MKRFKAFRPAVLLLCTAGALSSFSAQAFQQPGKITAGSDMTFFPYEYMENNKPAGFDIEFLAGLAKTMGREAVKIGSMGATSWLAQLQKLSADYCVKKGLKPIALSEYTTDPQTTQALLSRAVEAQITDAAVARGVIDKLGDRVIISSETLIYPVLNGFGVKKGNSEVKTALEEGLKKYSATPEYAALLKKYNFQAPTPEDLQTLMPKAE